MRARTKFMIVSLILVAGLALLGGGRFSNHLDAAQAVAADTEPTATPAWSEPGAALTVTSQSRGLPELTPPELPPIEGNLTACNPAGDQVGLYAGPNFQGECVVKDSGVYTDTLAIGLLGNPIASIQVGDYVTATLCQIEGFAGVCQVFSASEPDLKSIPILSDQAKSAIVQGCQPGPKQAALFSAVDYRGRCVILDTGVYTTSASLAPVGNDSADSLKVAAGAQAILCEQESFGGVCSVFTANTRDLRSSAVGANTVSSAKVQGLPDLRALPVIASPVTGTVVTGDLFAGSPTYFDWHYSNSGAGSALNSFTVEMWVNDTRFVNYPYQNVDAGKTRGFVDWAETVMDPGLQTVRLVIDPGNTVQESDETNNVWQGQLFWSMPDSWRGEYFNNETLAGAPALVRYDPKLDFSWQYASPGKGVNPDGFSVRWTRTLNIPAGGYEFILSHDDGARMWVDGRLALNAWATCCRTDMVNLALDGGEHLLVVEMFDHYGAAQAHLSLRTQYEGYRSFMPVIRRR